MKFIKSLEPIILCNHMKVANVSFDGGLLKVRIDYEKGNHYTFKKQIGGN